MSNEWINAQNENRSAEDVSSFAVRPAARVERLPPYMFGRINNLLYQKRRQGRDVIDLGMGNPSDPPEPQVIGKLAEAFRNYRQRMLNVRVILSLRKALFERMLQHAEVQRSTRRM